MNIRLLVLIISLICFSFKSNVRCNSAVVDKNRIMQNVSDTVDITLSIWIEKIIQEEKPDSSIAAYNFGLFESPEGYTVYLIGAKVFDAENSDWATIEDFVPKSKYCVLPPAKYKDLKWDQAFAKVESDIKKFMKSETYKNSFLAKAKAVTVGFDDGDLVRLQ